MAIRKWSPQQDQIFEWFKNSKKNLIVRARAGTGKTTTILEGINYAPETSILLVAFNRSIAVELQQKLKNPSAEAKTLHALGFTFIRQNWRQTKVDGERGQRLAEAVCKPTGAPKDVVNVVRKLASLTKNCSPTLDRNVIEDLAYEHDCFPDSENYSLRDIVDFAIKACELSLIEDGTIDFDDMIFIPVAKNWVRGKWSLVIVDEAQDMNPTQLQLAKKACKGRICVVGDDRQAIYGFRGADIGAIDKLKKELKADELGLTVTYRCPQIIVEYAKKLVPDYQAAPSADMGSIGGIEYSKLAAAVAPGDFVLSRKNAPLAGACLSVLRLGKPAKISGRDVAKSLLTLVNKWKDKGIENFLDKLTNWEKQEILKAEKYPENRKKVRIQLIEDQAETLRVLSEGCAQLAELRKRIENMFVDESQNPLGVVLFSSIHKAKGQERNRVYLFGETLYPGKSDSIEEENLEYVAVTRAKKDLIWVSGVTNNDEKLKVHE